MRKSISFVVGMIFILSMALPAFAADYAQNPAYTPVSSPSGATEIPASSVSASLAAGETIDITRGAKVLPLADLKSIIEEYKDKPGAVLSFESKQKGKEYLIKIPIDSIKNPRALNIDLGISNVPATTLLVAGEKVRIPEGSLYIVPEMKGDFGMTLDITFPGSHFSKGFDDADGVRLIYVNLLTGETYILTDFIPFNDDGGVSILLDKASAYYLIPANKPTEEKEEDSSDNKEENVNTVNDTNQNDNDDSNDDHDEYYDDDEDYEDDYDDEYEDYDDEEYENDFESDNSDEAAVNDNKPESQNLSTDISDKENKDSQKSSSPSQNNNTESDNSYTDPWWNSDDGELNPPTGTVFGGTAVAAGAAITTVLAKKHRHSHRRRRR